MPTTGALSGVPHGAEERRAAVVEDPAVRPRPASTRRLARCRSDDRCVQLQRGGISVTREVPVGEQLAERSEHGVAVAVDARCHTDHLAVGGRRRTRRRGRRRGPARLVLLGRRVVEGDSGGARRVNRPRWYAGHDAADDASHARHVLVALPVPELQASGEVRITSVGPATAVRPVTLGPAEGIPVTAPAVARTGGVAVHVVARAAAVTRIVRHPPAAHDRVGRAVVVAGHGATELAEARAAGAAASTAGVPALADLLRRPSLASARGRARRRRPRRSLRTRIC